MEESAAARKEAWPRIAAAALVASIPLAWLVDSRALVPAALATWPLLAALQWRALRRAGSPPGGSATLDGLEPGAGLLAVYALLLASSWRFLASWPRVGSLIDLPLMIVWVGVAYQVLVLAAWVWRRRPPRRRRVVRLASLPIGLVATGGFLSAASEAALENLTSEQAALLGALSEAPDPCAALHAHLSATARARRPRSLHAGAGRWILTFDGGSADVDGSTIVLESGRAQARVFHNDDVPQREGLEDRQRELTACDPAPGAEIPRP